jgi:hypothetical protein
LSVPDRFAWRAGLYGGSTVFRLRYGNAERTGQKKGFRFGKATSRQSRAKITFAIVEFFAGAAPLALDAEGIII